MVADKEESRPGFSVRAEKVTPRSKKNNTTTDCHPPTHTLTQLLIY